MEPVRISGAIRFGEDFELDAVSYTLRRGGRVLKLERIPMETLLFLAEQRGQLVSRQQIVERIWGEKVFLDTDNSINGAIRKIRTVLKDDAEEPRFIQTVTGKGYRFMEPVYFPEQPPIEAAAVRIPDGDLAGKPARPKRLPVQGIALGLAFVLAVALYLQRTKLLVPGAAPASRVMLAVLPFENLTGDAAQDYLSDGFTGEMTTQLGRTDPAKMGVIARTSVMVYKRNPRPLDEIGRKLGVQYVIEGSVRRDAGRVRITAQLIQMKDQTHVWAKEYDRDLKSHWSSKAKLHKKLRTKLNSPLVSSLKPWPGVVRQPRAAPRRMKPTTFT